MIDWAHILEREVLHFGWAFVAYAIAFHATDWGFSKLYPGYWEKCFWLRFIIPIPLALLPIFLREPWDAARKLVAFDTATRGPGGTLWRLEMKPSDAPAGMDRIAARHPVLYQYDLGGGRIWVWSREAEIPELHRDLQTEAARNAGHATLIHSAERTALRRFQPEPAPVARLTAGLRAQFDPRGILNPGLMG